MACTTPAPTPPDGGAAPPDGGAAPDDGGMRVAILINGTRGDAQPVLALALALRAKGCNVLMLCNSNYVSMMEDYGLSATGFPPDMGRVLEDTPGVRDLMDGKTKNFQEIKEPHEKQVERLRVVHQACQSFGPQLILYNLLLKTEAAILEKHLNVCTVLYQLQPVHGSATYPPPGVVRIPLNGNMFWWNLGTKSAIKYVKASAAKVAPEVLGSNPLQHVKANTLGHLGYSPAKHRICLCAISAHMLSRVPADWPKPTAHSGLHLTGFWTLTEAQQTSKPGHFGQSEEMARLRQFLEAGAPPVYIGWGSMIVVSAQFMAQLAVRSLLKVGKRGIILGGWAKLCEDSLGGAEDEAELRAFAASNILWLSQAPHEMLFPECSAVVHHGGSGSVAASLRAGKPTVVTPVWLDQFLFCHLVKRTGAGVGTQQLAKVTADELAEALRKCDSQEVIGKAAALGERLRAEDGAANAAAVVVQYMEAEVKTGRWRDGTAASKMGWCSCMSKAPPPTRD